MVTASCTETKRKRSRKKELNWPVIEVSYDKITPSRGKNNCQTQLTWFTAPRAPLKF
jgi:hypothetical protein